MQRNVGEPPDTPSLDDFICLRQQRWRDLDTKRLGGPLVDDQLEPRRLLDGQVGRFGAYSLRRQISDLATRARLPAMFPSQGLRRGGGIDILRVQPTADIVAVLFFAAVLTAEAQPAGKERLHELGYSQGRNMTFESLSAEGRPERLPQLAREAVRRALLKGFPLSRSPPSLRG